MSGWNGEERRRADDKQWDRINSYIDESREYRSALNVTLGYMKKTQEELSERIRIQNGRVSTLEEKIKPLVDSDARRGKIENIVGSVILAGFTAIVVAMFLWAGRALLIAFKSGS